MIKKIAYILFSFALFLAACHKPSPQTQEINLSNPGLIILNEGNFSYGNASITFFDITTSTVTNKAFEKANGLGLGDIAQSAYTDNSFIYIVVNNSGKIIKASLDNLHLQAQLTRLVSPRYLATLPGGKMIVTDLYSTMMTVFDPMDMTQVKKVYIGHTTERILVKDGFIYTISWNNDSMLFKINVNNYSIVDSLDLTYQPNSMVFDHNGDLWVLSDGGLWQGADTLMPAALAQIDVQEMIVKKSFTFDNISLSPSHLSINSMADTLYFLISSWTRTRNPVFGIYRMALNNRLPSKPWIKQGNHTFYALWYIKEKNWIVVTDAKDFTTPGQVLVYNSQANLLYTIPVGIIPGYVLYKK